MNFDVIIGNPPYQMSDGGATASAKPIYQKFIEQSKKLEPRYLLMIIPARWYAGGKGLDDFRNSMLNDRKIKFLFDYTDSKDCFSGVDISGGICYFLWDKNYNGKCKIINMINGSKYESERYLNEFSVFVRYALSENIIKKIRSFNEDTFDNLVSSRKPFGLDTSVKPEDDGDIFLRYSGGIGKYKKSNIVTGFEIINKWKTIISYVSYDHAGQPGKDGKRKVLSVIEVLPPDYICSETYLVAGIFDNEQFANNCMIYLETKFVRFLVAQIALSQHITKKCFSFVPTQDFSISWNDSLLFEKYKLNTEEIQFIENMIN